KRADGDREPVMPPTALTPQQAAKQALAAVGPSTRVTAEANVTVAGQAAYQLVLAPKGSGSLVRKGTIGPDGQQPAGPLRGHVVARGPPTPASQAGYPPISSVPPAASNFAFTPPAGARVHTVTLPSSGHPPYQQQRKLSGVRIVGKDWTSVAVLPASA